MVIIIAIVIKRIAYMVLRLFYKTLNLEGENKQTNKTNNNNKKTFKDHLPVKNLSFNSLCCFKKHCNFSKV